MSHPDPSYEAEIQHKSEPDLFCDCKECETYFTAKAEAMRLWQNATAEDTTDQAKEDIEARAESDLWQAESQYMSNFTN